MVMVKRSRTPSGFYSGIAAARRLGLSVGTFYKQVKAGKIKKYYPPGSGETGEGYYNKEEIEKMAQAKELFILLYSVEPVIFTRAASEDDIHGIVDLCVAIYGVGGTPSFETRRAIWQACPDAYWVLKQENIVVGYLSIIHFNDTALAYLMGKATRQLDASPAGTGVYAVTGPENILPYIEGQPIEHVFISLGVRPGMSNTQQREYGFRILHGALDVLKDFARRGMPVRMVYATSDRQDGIFLARKIGMQETRYPGDNLLRFELNLETAETPLAAHYRQAVQKLS